LPISEVLEGNLGSAEVLVNMIRERAGNCAQGEAFRIDYKDLADPTDDDTTAVAGKDVIVADIDNPLITWANYEVQTYPTGTFESEGPEFAMEAVRWEGRLELALEGHRLFDLRRWGTAEEVLNAFTEKAAETRTYYENAETYTAKHRWYPIPTTQILANTRNGVQLIKQNPEY